MQKKKALLLFCYFSIAIIAAIGILNFIFGLLVYFFDHSQSIWWHKLSPYIVMFIVVLISSSTIIKFWQYKYNGRAIAHYHQATRLKRKHAVPEELRALDINDELAEEFRVTPAHLYVLYDELGINALTVGYTDADVSIIVTWGALQAMNPDELRGMLAHEYCHIRSKAYTEHTHLEVLLAGCLTISQIGSYLIVQGTERKALAADSIFAAINLALGAFIWLIGSLGILISRILKFIIFYFRQADIDVQTCEWVEPEYLLHALTRIYVHEKGSHIYRVQSEALAHYCFANPLNEQSWFTVHPALASRIKNLHPNFGRKAVVEQKSYWNWQSVISKILLPTNEEEIQELLDAQQSSETSNLVALRLQPRYPLIKDATRALSPEVRQAMERPELLIRAMQTATGCREVIIAIFTIRQYREFIPDDVLVSHAIVEALLKLDERVYSQILYEAVQNIGQMPTIISRQFLAKITQIIQVDNEICLLDCLLLEQLKASQGLLEEAIPIAKHNCLPAVVHLVDALLYVHYENVQQVQKLREKTLKRLLSYSEYQQFADMSNQPLSLAHSLRLLSGLLVRQKFYLLALLEREIWSERIMTQDELDVMQLLYWRFGYNSEDMLQRTLRQNSLFIG